MNADRWRASHEGIDQLRDGRLPPEKSFRGGKTTSVFEFVPEGDRQWFARRYRRALSECSQACSRHAGFTKNIREIGAIRSSGSV